MDGCRIEREFRGVRYSITVKRGEDKGLFVGGEKIPGNTIPLSGSGTEVTVII